MNPSIFFSFRLRVSAISTWNDPPANVHAALILKEKEKRKELYSFCITMIESKSLFFFPLLLLLVRIPSSPFCYSFLAHRGLYTSWWCRKLYKLLRPSVVVCWHEKKNHCQKKRKRRRIHTESWLPVRSLNVKSWLTRRGVGAGRWKVRRGEGWWGGCKGGSGEDLMMATAIAVRTHTHTHRALAGNGTWRRSMRIHTHCALSSQCVWPWRIFFFLSLYLTLFFSF